MWLNAPAPSCVFHGIPSLCHLCLRHVVLWRIHKMQVVLKQCNGLLKRVSSSTQAQSATCLHGNWELNVSLVLFFFNVSLACLRRMVLCPIGYHQPNWPQWCKARWLAAAWMQCVVCHGNDSVVCCLWLQKASFIRRIFFCGRAGKTAPKPAAENHVSVFCVFVDKEWLVFTRSHVNLEPEFVIKTFLVSKVWSAALRLYFTTMQCLWSTWSATKAFKGTDGILMGFWNDLMFVGDSIWLLPRAHLGWHLPPISTEAFTRVKHFDFTGSKMIEVYLGAAKLMLNWLKDNQKMRKIRQSIYRSI